jgi:hypothetical protein
MPTLALVFKCIAPLMFVVSALHLSRGRGADALLGANLSVQSMNDPGLDSQNRFYGVSFALYGVLLFVCAADLRKYATVLKCVLWMCFAAGVARLVSMAVVGTPPLPILALLASELLAPPLLLWWLSKTLNSPS